MKIFFAILAVTLAGKTLAGGVIYSSDDYKWTGQPVLGCIAGNNARNIYNVDTVETCQQHCVNETGFLCLSLDYNSEQNLCHLSRASSDTVAADAFHMPCYNNPDVVFYAGRRLKDCRASDGWMEFEDHCYRAIGDSTGSPNSWSEIRDACESAGPHRDLDAGPNTPIAYLADVRTAEENDFIAKDVLEGARGWLGARRTGPDYEWTDEPVLGCIRYNNDRNIENVDTVEACQRHCVDETEFLCLSIDYNSAQNLCHLSRASSDTVAASDFVQPCYNNPDVVFYAGRRLTEEEFVWDLGQTGDSSPPLSAGYTNWKPNQPSNSGGDEDCVEINRGPSGAWNDLPCRRMRLGVCKFTIE